MFVFPGKLSVAVDRTAPGSEGRLVLQMPEEFLRCVGHTYRPVGTFRGSFGGRKVVTLLREEHGTNTKTVTPKRQIWWKNGVKDHDIRENWNCNVYAVATDDDFVPRIIVVELTTPTGETKPLLPPRQVALFDE